MAEVLVILLQGYLISGVRLYSLKINVPGVYGIFWIRFRHISELKHAHIYLVDGALEWPLTARMRRI